MDQSLSIIYHSIINELHQRKQHQIFQGQKYMFVYYFFENNSNATANVVKHTALRFSLKLLRHCIHHYCLLRSRTFSHLISPAEVWGETSCIFQVGLSDNWSIWSSLYYLIKNFNRLYQLQSKWSKCFME